MKSKLYIYLVGLAIAAMTIAGCVSGPLDPELGDDGGFSLSQLVANDANNALLMAQAAGDPLAEKCWTYLREVAIENAAGDVEAGDVVGVLSAYQKARNVRRHVTDLNISDDFKLNCGPMLIDSAGALRRLGVKIAVPFL